LGSAQKESILLSLVGNERETSLIVYQARF